MIETNLLLSAIQLAEHIKNTPTCKKVLTYHNTVQTSIRFKKTLYYIFKQYDIQGYVYHMCGTTNMNTRKKILDEFQEGKSDVSIICSSRVLSEGIDIPCVDTVVFVDPRTSTIDVTQCCGRGMRLYGEQTTCDIIIPVHYEKSLKQHNYSNIVSILSAMVNIYDKIIEYYVTKKPNNKVSIKNFGTIENSKDDRIKYSLEDVSGNIELEVIKSEVLKWEYKLALLFEYCDIHEYVPPKTEEYKGQLIGKWLVLQMKKIEKNTDEMYERLAANRYVKDYMDEYLMDKNRIDINDFFCNKGKTKSPLPFPGGKSNLRQKSIATQDNSNFSLKNSETGIIKIFKTSKNDYILY